MTWPHLQAATTLSHIHSYSTVAQKPIHENEDWQTWTNEKIEVSPNKLGGALTFDVPIGVNLIYPTKGMHSLLQKTILMGGVGEDRIR